MLVFFDFLDEVDNVCWELFDEFSVFEDVFYESFDEFDGVGFCSHGFFNEGPCVHADVKVGIEQGSHAFCCDEHF